MLLERYTLPHPTYLDYSVVGPWSLRYLETSCTDGSVRDELEDEAVGPGLYVTWKPPALMDLSVIN